MNLISYKWIAPLFSGAGIGIAAVSLFKSRPLWFFIIWFVISLVGLISYMSRAIYWEDKYKNE